MRKHYLDNIRWLCVLFLFPYHTFMVFNSFGESFYVKGADIEATTRVLSTAWPWIMPLLFLIAGASSSYALGKRTAGEYAKERVYKLLIPLLFGILLLVPVQTYFAEVFHNGYAGGYFEQYVLFFTKPTDLSGYNGGFTPAHLWFILYLFIMSVIALPVMSAYQKSAKKLPVGKIPLPALLMLFIIPVFSQMILDISGKSFGEYLTWFLFGFFFISDEDIQEKLEKYRFFFLGLALPCIIIYNVAGTAIENFNKIIFEMLYSFYAWSAILAILGLGRRYLNFSNKAMSYLSESSFSVYVFHQQWIVVAGFFSLKWIHNVPMQMAAILLSSVVLTFATVELLKRLSPARFMFGIAGVSSNALKQKAQMYSDTESGAGRRKKRYFRPL